MTGFEACMGSQVSGAGGVNWGCSVLGSYLRISGIAQDQLAVSQVKHQYSVPKCPRTSLKQDCSYTCYAQSHQIHRGSIKNSHQQSQQKTLPGLCFQTETCMEKNTEESRIQIWFQNQRDKHALQRRLEPVEASESNQGHGQDRPKEMIQGGEASLCHTSYTFSQLHTFTRVFKNNS